MAVEVSEVGGSGRTIELWGGSRIILRTVGEETGGTYSALEYIGAPGAGSSLHLHHNEDESFYILEGALTFQLGEEKIRAIPGAFVNIPRETRHAFVNAEDVPVRSLVILYPAGLEGFFIDMGELVKAYPEGPPNAEVIEAIVQKYNLEFF